MLVAATALAALPAVAATPSTGTVGREAAEAKWAGNVTDPLGAAYFAAVQSGSADDACGSPAPACDSFTLTVADAGAATLTVSVRADLAEDWIGLSVTGPDGTERIALNESDEESIKIESPAAGEYAVKILASPVEPRETGYSGVAAIAFPPPPAPPAPSPTPEPPAPAAPAEPPPPPPVQAGPRELAVQPDVRRVASAVRGGFRTRVVCHGGCRTVKLRVFVSSLTARTYKIGEFKGDVHVGGAPLLRDAEGRREATIAFKRLPRKQLARARNLTLAIEAVARDYDGQVRTTVKRITLRR